MTSLRITEIFCSLQGESSLVGLPTVFVRLTGCPLRCGYCDTAYAFKGGESLELETILDQVAAFGVQHVTVTGGEPLAQTSCHALLVALCDAGYRVSLETSGALDVAEVDSRVKRVMDIKTPSSGEVDRNLWSNLKLLVPDDEVKFVIGDRDDYAWSKGVVSEHSLASRCGVLFSPVYGLLEARTLADWIVEDRLPVRFQIQLHKLLWGDRPGV
ncbi:MAG: 7-carboxy-7-deazaguanine synthase QueE [Gammaproteobacteria bacterium]|jgi:7-carboxy-7-deazaguanine synthase